MNTEELYFSKVNGSSNVGGSGGGHGGHGETKEKVPPGPKKGRKGNGFRGQPYKKQGSLQEVLNEKFKETTAPNTLLYPSKVA